MQKLLTLILGLGLAVYSIYSMVDGSISGLADSGYSRLVYADKEPIYFWISSIFILCFGLLLVWGAAERHTKGDIKKHKKPWEIEIK